MPLPRLSALDTMDPLDRARALAKLLLDLVPEAKKGDKIYDLGALCPEVFAKTNCKESMTADWEYIDPIYNRSLGSQFSVEAVSGEICRGKNGVDSLLDFLEWFTKYQALDKCLYQGKLALLSEAMRKISPEAFDLSLSRGQSPNPFMATLSSGAISSQQQSMLPPLPQQWSVPPPHPQQQSAFPFFFNNGPHLLPLSNSNLHSFPTNGPHSLPNNSLCHFPYSWKLSLIMWMLLDQMMKAILPH